VSENLNKKRGLHFIIGIGRSGTTLLNKLLIDHPQLHCLPEANFLVFFLNQYKGKKQFYRSDIDLIFKQISIYSLSHPWVGWNFDIERVKEEVISKVSEGIVSYQEVCKLIYSHFDIAGITKSGDEILIDKNPSYTIFADKIESNFPEARFIWLIRDYRANVLSRKQNTDLKSAEISFNAMRWKLFNSFAYNFYLQNKEKVLFLKYEDLVLDCENALKKIYSFLNIEQKEITDRSIYDLNVLEPGMIPGHHQRVLKKYNDLNKPVNAERVTSWKQELSEKEILVCEALCSDFSQKFGYTSVNKLGWLKRKMILLSVSGSILKAYIDFYKDRLIYYAPLSLKLKRLQKRYQKIGLFKK
jgi:hypothetical protein